MNNCVQPVTIKGFFNLLLATDGSEFSRSAEILVAAYLLRFGGEVTAMQMVLNSPELESLGPDLLQQQQQIALKHLDEVKARLALQGASCKLLLTQGEHPHQSIIDAALEIDADLVVVGRRGRRGLARLMLGDSTARLVAHCPCSLLVVPRSGSALWATSILLATDGSSHSERASLAATMFAKQAGLPLRVISVVESKSSIPNFEMASAAVERAVVHAKNAGVTVEGAVLEGHPPADIIAKDVFASGAGLVVGGSHGRTGLGQVFIGSVMERLLGKVVCPVLVVKAK